MDCRTSVYRNIVAFCQEARVQCRINASLYTILQVLSLTVFEKTPLLQLLTNPETTNTNPPPC